MSASLTTQRMQRTMLAASPDVLALVPADHILDTGARPEVWPSVIIGEDQELPADDVVGRYSTIYSTLHVWSREGGIADAKIIAGAVRKALHRQTWQLGGYKCIDTKFQSARFLRDPDGKTAHGVVTFVSIVEEL